MGNGVAGRGLRIRCGKKQENKNLVFGSPLHDVDSPVCRLCYGFPENAYKYFAVVRSEKKRVEIRQRGVLTTIKFKGVV